MISIVVPAFNEEKRIGRMLDAYCTRFPLPFELVVVLNGCTDHTLAVVKEKIAAYPKVTLRFLDISEAIGKGGAIRKGFKESVGEYIGFVDADMATTPEEFARLSQILIAKSEFSGVIGSRLLPTAQVSGRSMTRTVVSKMFAMLVRFLTDLPYADTQCGAKIFSQAAVKAFLPRLSATDMTIDVDILLACRRLHLNLHEEPTEWFDQSSSAMLGSSFGFFKTSFRMLNSLIKLTRSYE